MTRPPAGHDGTHQGAPPSKAPTQPPPKGSLLSLLITGALLVLIALTVGMTAPALAGTMVVSTLGVAVMFHRAFASSRSFSLALTNLIGAYSSLFLFFSDSNFPLVGTPARALAYVIPLASFLMGCLHMRRRVDSVATARRLREQQHFGRLVAWLLPIFGIGVVTFMLPTEMMTPPVETAALLLAQVAIAGIVFPASLTIALFLLDTGLLFEALFRRLHKLLVPVFVFLSFYGVTLMVFAALYQVIDEASRVPLFKVDGVSRHVSFPECMYFSLTTLSTVGYGDIIPVGNAIRFFVSVEVIVGVLLLLFGFNEIFSYARDERIDERVEDPAPTPPRRRARARAKPITAPASSPQDPTA